MDADDFREALSHWASTVTVLAVRDGSDIHAVTVTSFVPVSAEPPRILVSLGPNAKVLPFLQPGTGFTVSFLAEGQSRIGSVFADAYPVGPSPFPADGPPTVSGALLGLVCAVHRVVELEAGVHLVVGEVNDVEEGTGVGPLLYHRRGYATLRST